MNTINRGLWVNETNDAYEMRVKNSCFNARSHVRNYNMQNRALHYAFNIIIARSIFTVFILLLHFWRGNPRAK